MKWFPKIALFILLVAISTFASPGSSSLSEPGVIDFTTALSIHSRPGCIPMDDESDYFSMVYTHGTIVLFSYYDSTELSVEDSLGTTVFESTLNRGEHRFLSVPRGFYSVNSNKRYSVLIGDPIGDGTCGYFAVDQYGSALSCTLYTFCPDTEEWNMEDRTRNVLFSYSDDTNIEIQEIGGGFSWSGTLDAGEYHEWKGELAFRYLGIYSDKPVAFQHYNDAGFFVPSANGSWTGTLFYAYSGGSHGGGHSWPTTDVFWLIIALEDNTHALLTNQEGDTIFYDYLDEGETAYFESGVTYPEIYKKYITLETDKDVYFCSSPLTSRYMHLVFVPSNDGQTGGTDFHVPTCDESHIIAFGKSDSTDVEIVSPTGTSYYFTVNGGEFLDYSCLETGIYQVHSDTTLIVLEYSRISAGSEFVPLFFTSEALIPQSPDSFFVWPQDSSLCVGDTMVLIVPCGSYGQDNLFNIDSTKIGIFADDDTISEEFYETGDWCWSYRVMNRPGLWSVEREIFALDSIWRDTLKILVCDNPSISLNVDSIICPEIGSAEVCIENEDPLVSLDLINWSDGSHGMCTDVPLTLIETPCGGVNSFLPETIWVEVGHLCTDGELISTCYDYDTLIIEPYFDFWLDIAPSGVHPGELIDLIPRTRPDIPTDWPVWIAPCIDGDTSSLRLIRYQTDTLTITAIDSNRTYCAWFDYYGCQYWACDSVTVADTLLTIIKTSCLESEEGYIQVEGARSYGHCQHTFPIYNSCVEICVSDTDSVGYDIAVFDHWERSDGVVVGYNSCTMYCFSSLLDTVYAVYQLRTMDLAISGDTSAIAIEIDEYLSALDSVFSRNNPSLDRKFFLTNTGTADLDIQVKWNGITNLSEYICPQIKLTNLSIPEPDKVGLRGSISSSSTPSSYFTLANYYKSIYDLPPYHLNSGNTKYLYLGVVSPSGYNVCYPSDTPLKFKISLSIRWNIYLP